MLRGSLADVTLLTSLMAIGVFLFLLAWFLLGRAMKRAV
jgi:hypothetical protein